MRDRDIYLAFKESLKTKDFNSLIEAADYARLSPAPQYYIDSRTASLLVGKVLKGMPLGNMFDCQRRRIESIVDSYKAYLYINPNTKLSRERIVEIIVNQPAPEFYVSLERARKIIQQQNLLAKKRFIDKL